MGSVGQWAAPHIDSGVRAALFVMDLAGPSVAAFLALLYFTSERDRSRAALAEEHRLLEAERDRSEHLLLNILPAPIAQQLRDGRTTIAESQPDVSTTCDSRATTRAPVAVTFSRRDVKASHSGPRLTTTS